MQNSVVKEFENNPKVVTFSLNEGGRMSETLEWARYQVRCNALAPGYFLSEISSYYLETDVGKAMVRRIPMRRLGDPTELDAALLLLASSASRYMTGSVVSVDGGLSLSIV